MLLEEDRKSSEQYRIGYNNGKWKFAIHNSNTNGGGDGWHDYGVTVPESQKTEWNKITAFYTEPYSHNGE